MDQLEAVGAGVDLRAEEVVRYWMGLKVERQMC